MTRQRVWNRYSAGIATNYERAEHPLSLATGRMLLGQIGGRKKTTDRSMIK